MPALLRIELFPASMPRFLAFYTNVLRFTLVRNSGTYAYLKRDSVLIGANTAWPEHRQSLSAALVPDGQEDKTLAHGDTSLQLHRHPPAGVELVLEVDDLDAERQWVREKGWSVVAHEDIKMQFWGLRDFRLCDPDGFYWRITEHSSEGRPQTERNHESAAVQC